MSDRRTQSRWPSRLLRFTIRVFGLLLFVLFLAAVWLWHVPQSPKALQDAVRRRLELATGAVVRFEGAEPRFLVPDRLLEIRNIAFFSDSGRETPDFRVGSINVTVSRRALLSPRSPDAVERITVSGPTRIEYTYAPDGIRPGASAIFLARTLERIRQTTASASGQVRIDDLEIALLERSDDKEVAAGQKGSTTPAILLRGDLTATTSRSSGAAAAFEGMIEAAGIHSSIRGILAAHSPTSRTLDLDLGKMRVAVPFRGKTALLSTGAKTHVRLNLLQTGPLFSLSGGVEISDITIDAPQVAEFPLQDRNVALRLSADYDTSATVLAVHDAIFSSDLVRAEVRGTAAGQEPFPFDMETTAVRLGGAYRELLARLLPPGYRIDAPDEAFRLSAAARGDRTALQEVAGSLLFTSVTLTSPALPKPLRNLSGDIVFGPGHIELQSVSASTGQSSLQLDGNLTGDYLRGGESLLRLNWKGRTTAADLSDILATGSLSDAPDTAGATPVLPRPVKSPVGNITGSGTLRQQVSLRSSADAFAPPEVDGTIRLANVDLIHPKIPAPLQSMNGVLRVEGDTVRIESLRGYVSGTPVTVQGSIAGQRYFWSNPEVNATVTAQVDLDRLPEEIPLELRSATDRYRLGGKADARLQVQTTLSRPQEARLTGAVSVANGQAELPLGESGLSLRAVDASLSWDGTALLLDRFSARVNGEAFTASGLLSPDQVSLTANGQVELAAIPRAFPLAARWVDISGPAEIDLRCGSKNKNSGNRSPARSGASPGEDPVLPNHYTDVAQETGTGTGTGTGTAEVLLDLLRNAGPRIGRGLSDGTLGIEGAITFGNAKAGARLRHNAMPGGERRNELGRAIPQAELRNVRGRVVFRDNTLSTPAGGSLTCDLADTKNCTIATTIQLRPDNFPKMTITAVSRSEANFDTWLTGWGKELPVPPSPPDTGRSFELDASFSSPRAIYKGQRAGATRLQLTYSLLHRPNSPRRTVFKTVQVNGAAGGRMIASGEMLSYAWKPAEFPSWSAQARFEQMPMLPLLTWVFQDVRNIDGFATGHLNVEGIKSDALSVRGSGSTVMTDLIIDRTPLIRGLAQATGRQFQGRRFSSVDTTNFTIGDGALSSRDLNLDSAGGLLLEMRGSYFFANSPRYRARAQTIDERMRLKVFQSMLQQLPIVSGIPLVGDLAGGVSQLADEVAGAFLLAFQVSGSTDQPQITPIALPLFQGAD